MADYKGYREIEPSDNMLSKFYSSDMTENFFNALENEYIAFKNAEGEIIDAYRWTGYEYQKVKFKTINSEFYGVVKPRNWQQRFAFDMLQDHKTTIKLLSGTFGSFKTGAMVIHALQQINEGRFQKLIWIRNAVDVKDAPGTGFLPGSLLDKSIAWAGPLMDHVGGEERLRQMIDEGIIEIIPLSMIRGRDLRNSIVFCSESENMTVHHIQLLIGRIGEGSELWIEGDRRQTDKSVFEKNSGMERLVERLAGNRLFGYVDMPISERSETSRLADLLD